MISMLVMKFAAHSTQRLSRHLSLRILHQQMFSDKHVFDTSSENGIR